MATQEEMLQGRLAIKDELFANLKKAIKAVPWKFKQQAKEEWNSINLMVTELGERLGDVTEFKGIVAVSPETKLLYDAIIAHHTTFTGSPTARIGKRTRFGEMLEQIKIAALNLQPVVDDDGDEITFEIVATLAVIADKTTV
jgi:hypothetical protein